VGRSRPRFEVRGQLDDALVAIAGDGGAALADGEELVLAFPPGDDAATGQRLDLAAGEGGCNPRAPRTGTLPPVAPEPEQEPPVIMASGGALGGHGDAAPLVQGDPGGFQVRR